ncbi:hypothetical protein M0R45_035215 [Rubus argutus]|uniref:Uncharacterized protein n=1 Tax=Rubus argutus TaxID=59490 RepID=A0AAW1VTJ2_RUBAR
MATAIINPNHQCRDPSKPVNNQITKLQSWCQTRSHLQLCHHSAKPQCRLVQNHHSPCPRPHSGLLCSAVLQLRRRCPSIAQLCHEARKPSHRSLPRPPRLSLRRHSLCNGRSERE